MNLRGRLVWVLFASAVVSGVGHAMIGCASAGPSGTTGKRVSLRTRVTIDAASRTAFTNALGYTITLSKAYLAIGPLYYFDGESIFSTRVERFDPFAPRRAWAHPGHYLAGNAKGEMVASDSVDLLAASSALGDGQGISGPYHSARFTFGAPGGRFASALGSNVVVIEGEAKRATETLRFRATAAREDVLDTYGEPRLDGCSFQSVDVQSNGTVTLTIAPRIWLDQVDFAELKPASEPVELTGVARNGFVRGLVKGNAYVFSYTAGGA